MVIVPHTRPKWRVQFGILFVIAAWWCNSWAWYTVSGLLVCDMVMHMDFKQNALMGIPIQFRGLVWRSSNGQPRRLPTWVVGGLLLVGGLLMQYLWAAYRPDLFYSEWRIHSNPYTTPGLDQNYRLDHISARDDVYLTILGIFTLLETYDILQRALQNKFLLFLGRRALSKWIFSHCFSSDGTILICNRLLPDSIYSCLHCRYPGVRKSSKAAWNFLRRISCGDPHHLHCGHCTCS